MILIFFSMKQNIKVTWIENKKICVISTILLYQIYEILKQFIVLF